MRYGKSLYRTNETYTVHIFKNRDEWLAGRLDLHGIGGSDASAACGLNPWRDNVDLWEIKTGRKKAPDISDNERVQYGQEAEEYLRRLYQLKNKDKYEVQYIKDVILQNNEHPEFLYSPDGLLFEKATGRKGIWECKTTTIMKSFDKEKWNNKVPDNYFVQTLHGLNTTGFDFVELFAELTYPGGYSQLRTYHFERADHEEDCKFVSTSVQDFWTYVQDDRRPSLKMPAI